MVSAAPPSPAPRREEPRDKTWRYTGAACREFDPLRIGAFVKTQLCRFHQKGICCKGEGCSYAHSEEELQPAPDLARTKRCRTLILKGECKNPDCKYAHGRQELVGTTVEVRRSRGTCKFWVIGTCTLGARCTHAHEKLETTGSKRPSMELDGSILPHRKFSCEDFFEPMTVPVLDDSWTAEASSLNDLGNHLLNLAGLEFERWEGSRPLSAEDEVTNNGVNHENEAGETTADEKDTQEDKKTKKEVEETTPAGEANVFSESREGPLLDPMGKDLPWPMRAHAITAPVEIAAPPGLPHPQALDMPQMLLRCTTGSAHVAVVRLGDVETPCHLTWTMRSDIGRGKANATEQKTQEMKETQDTSQWMMVELDTLNVLRRDSDGKAYVGDEDLSSVGTASGAEASWVTAPLSESEPESVLSMI